MDFSHDARTTELIDTMRGFLDERIYPAEPILKQQVIDSPTSWSLRPIVRELQVEARERGLWNLFLPGTRDDGSSGLSNLQYAPIAELSGRSHKLAPIAMNCAAPDTGNMEVLNEFGTDAQKAQWLDPLLAGSIRSSFCMTEPDVASSDATNISTRIRRDGDSYVVTGRKWWSTGAMNPDAAIFIVMGKTDPDAERHRQQSMILVPRETPGVNIVRPLTVFGYDDRDHGGHAEIEFNDVRVPAGNLVSGEGDGFAIAQARLGPGRIHHCMRALGMAERAMELMKERATARVAFGRPLSEQGVIREWIGESRITIEALRLLVLKTAWLMDTAGNRAAMTEIQAIKIAVPRAAQAILDRAIQLYGGAGLSDDEPLAEMFAGARALRLADGPDEVHLSSLGASQLRHRPTQARG
jgi:acyl-CoA dehydrogenase